MNNETAIWPPLEALYIQSMLFNSTSAVRSIARLEHIFGQLPERPTDADVDRLPARQILNELQNMVVQAAALSRYFWPVRGEFKARGELLRGCFAMADGNPLFNRELRNAIEHFDERVDRYFHKDRVGCFFPEYVGAKPVEDDVPGHFFRAFFVDTGEFRLLDQDFEVKPVADEVLFVHSHLVHMDRRGGRLEVAVRSDVLPSSEGEGNQES